MAAEHAETIVQCVRCAAAAAHPWAELPKQCPNCVRDRDAV